MAYTLEISLIAAIHGHLHKNAAGRCHRTVPWDTSHEMARDDLCAGFSDTARTRIRNVRANKMPIPPRPAIGYRPRKHFSAFSDKRIHGACIYAWCCLGKMTGKSSQDGRRIHRGMPISKTSCASSRQLNTRQLMGYTLKGKTRAWRSMPLNNGDASRQDK